MPTLRSDDAEGRSDEAEGRSDEAEGCGTREAPLVGARGAVVGGAVVGATVESDAVVGAAVVGAFEGGTSGSSGGGGEAAASVAAFAAFDASATVAINSRIEVGDGSAPGAHSASSADCAASPALGFVTAARAPSGSADGAATGGRARAVSGAAPLGECGVEFGGVWAGESPGEESAGVPLPEQGGVPLPEQGGVSKGLPPKPSPKPSPPPTHTHERPLSSAVSSVAAEPMEAPSWALPAGESRGDSASAGGEEVSLWPCRPPDRHADHHCWLLGPSTPSKAISECVGLGEGIETGDERASGDESADEFISSFVLRRCRDAAIGGTSAPGEPTLEAPPLVSLECLFAPLALRVVLLALAVPFLLVGPTAAGDDPPPGRPRPLLLPRADGRIVLLPSAGTVRSSSSCLRDGGRPGCSEGFSSSGLVAAAIALSPGVALARWDGRGGSMQPSCSLKGRARKIEDVTTSSKQCRPSRWTTQLALDVLIV